MFIAPPLRGRRTRYPDAGCLLQPNLEGSVLTSTYVQVMAMETEKMHPKDIHVDLGGPQKPLTDEKGFARSDLER